MAPHTLSVEGNKVIEKSAMGEVVKTSDYEHVIRGYKATLGRDDVSEEAKTEARQLLHDLQKAHKPFEKSGEAEESKSAEGHHHQRRKSVSKHVHDEGNGSHEHKPGEPRPHRYEESGDEVPLPHEGETHEEEVHRHRVAGYYKGILHKAGATDDAKAHAREILDKMGVEYEE
ncbi:hypothetical protein JCM8115_001966 [Rhodotorula mucilaginosa]|nr:hypothetical protein B0A53_05431 [Rhodotorula sp. CCFEE 5036]